MIMCGKNYFYLCLLFATGTIVQIFLHAGFAVYGYYMNTCATSPTNAPSIFFYLTYLYRDTCGKLNLEKSDFSQPFGVLFKTSANLNNIIEEILERASLPENASTQPRVWRYLLGLIIIDSAWLVASVALIMGVCLRIKEHYTIIYYGPWLFVTALVLLIDAAATVHFTFDIFQTTTFTNWMKFVGIKNVQDLQDIDEKNTEVLLSMAPTLVMLTFLSKFIVFWVMNIFGLYYVIQATNFSYNQSYKSEHSRRHQQNNTPKNSDLELDTSEARIRNWQLFYGATQTSHSSAESVHETDFNSNSRQKMEEEQESQNTASSEKVVTIASTSASYFGYPRVDSVDLGCFDELRGQKPWSYFPGHEDSALNVIKQHTEEALVINNESDEVPVRESVQQTTETI